MLYHLSIHHPKPEHEQDLIDSMHRFGAAARECGAVEAHTFKDVRSDALVGFALWRSDDDLFAARPSLAEAVEHDDFDAWETGPIPDAPPARRVRPAQEAAAEVGASG